MSARPQKPTRGTTDLDAAHLIFRSRAEYLKCIQHSWRTWSSRAVLPPALRSPDTPAELSDYGTEMVAALAELSKLTPDDLAGARRFLEASVGEKVGCSYVEVVRWACVLAGSEEAEGTADAEMDVIWGARAEVERTAQTRVVSNAGRGSWRGNLCLALLLGLVVFVFCLALLTLDERAQRRRKRLARGGAGVAWFDHLGLPGWD